MQWGTAGRGPGVHIPWSLGQTVGCEREASAQSELNAHSTRVPRGTDVHSGLRVQGGSWGRHEIDVRAVRGTARCGKVAADKRCSRPWVPA